jgi:hypothetical protein
MLTRRAILVGALATGALMRPRTSRATASQPAIRTSMATPPASRSSQGAPTPRRWRCLKRWRRSTKRSISSAW